RQSEIARVAEAETRLFFLFAAAAGFQRLWLGCDDRAVGAADGGDFALGRAVILHIVGALERGQLAHARAAFLPVGEQVKAVADEVMPLFAREAQRAQQRIAAQEETDGRRDDGGAIAHETRAQTAELVEDKAAQRAAQMR